MGQKGPCCNLCHSVLPMFSSKSVKVPGLAFRSLIHFEFIFVYRVTECSNFIILHLAVQFSQHQLLKRLSFRVFGLTFRPLIHFEFIFVYGVRECSNFILLHVAV